MKVNYHSLVLFFKKGDNKDPKAYPGVLARSKVTPINPTTIHLKGKRKDLGVFLLRGMINPLINREAKRSDKR